MPQLKTTYASARFRDIINSYPVKNSGKFVRALIKEIVRTREQDNEKGFQKRLNNCLTIYTVLSKLEKKHPDIKDQLLDLRRQEAGEYMTLLALYKKELPDDYKGKSSRYLKKLLWIAGDFVTDRKEVCAISQQTEVKELTHISTDEFIRRKNADKDTAQPLPPLVAKALDVFLDEDITVLTRRDRGKTKAALIKTALALCGNDERRTRLTEKTAHLLRTGYLRSAQKEALEHWAM